MRFELSSSTFGEKERKAIIKVVDSGMFTMGRKVRAFEDKFAAFFKVKHAVMVNSGSSADLIATASLFHRRKNTLKKGDEVIVPCISWATTYYPLHQYGLRLKFVDVDLETLNYDIAELKKAISPKTKMIVAVSVLGNPCRFDEISALCKKHKIILFEDNCESMGAKFKGRYTGTFGLINTFSTFFSHHISTIEGGLILTNDFELYCICKSLRNHGWTRDQEPGSPIYGKKTEDFFEAYRFILPGYNLRPTEIQGAVGGIQLTKLNRFLKLRRENAKYFNSLFKNDPRFIIQKETGESSWFCFTMILRPDYRHLRSKIFNALRKAGIEFRIITGGCMLKHDVFKYFDCEVTKSENADYAHENGFFVGNHPFDIKEKIDHLKKVLDKI